MFHTVAYTATGIANTDVDMTPITDGLMVIQNAHFLPQVDMNLLYAFSGGLTQNRNRIVTPTTRQVTTPQIRPLDNAASPGNLAGIADYRQNPFTLKGLEEISLVMQNTSTAVVQTVLGLSRTPVMPAPQGNIYTMRGTGTTTLAALGWTSCAITWSDSLPSGMYLCVGLSAFSTTVVAARLTFENQWERPGCIGTALVTSQEPAMFNAGGLGVWGQFHSYRMPSVEFLAVSADTAQTVFLDFIRVG
jgi:hypothetical protein